MSRPGVVTAGTVPLRRAPDHASEQVSQALLGEGFEIEGEAEAGAWWEVRLDADGYRGWLRSWYGRPLEDEAAVKGPRSSIHRVRTAVETARAAPRRSAAPVALLPWQARMRIVRREGSWAVLLLPGGEEAYLAAAALAEGPNPGGAATPSRVLRTARQWLGSPYLWGGRTPAGFDCSGLVQAVWAWHGVSLPRDAEQQREFLAARGRKRQRAASAEVGAEARPGDLLFFGPSMETVTHVGVALGSCEFIHAYGTVCLGSLSKSSQLFVNTLVDRFIGAWPVRPAHAKAGS